MPVVQALCATGSRERYAAGHEGLSPLDVAMQIAIPEFDGRVVGVPVSFKEEQADGTVAYAPDPERCRRAAGIAVRLARLAHTRNADKRVAVVLSNYPTKHARVGNAVGLDTPASAVALLDRLTAEGYDTGDWPTCGLDGTALVHRLIAAGGFDPEWLSDAQVAAQPARVSAAAYAGWFAGIDPALAARIQRHWGPPPGDVLVDRGDLVFATIAFGNVLLAIQPPRGFGENPVAIYHDPDLPPDPPLPRVLPLAGRRVGRRRRRAPGQARDAGVAARQGQRAVRRLRARRRAGRPAAGLPVRRQRPRRGHPGQAPRPRRDRRPPRPADDPRRDLRRARAPRAAPRRVLPRRAHGPGEGPGAARRDLAAAAQRRADPRPRAGGRRRGRPRRPPAAHRRLPLRAQGRPDPRRPAHPRPRAGGRRPRRARPGDPAAAADGPRRHAPPGAARRGRRTPRRRRGLAARRPRRARAG